MSCEQTIPVVDFNHLSGTDAKKKAEAVQLVGCALEDIGFFSVMNHGVDLSTIERAYDRARQFFLLPDEVKFRYEDPQSKGQRGFTRFGKEHAKDSSAPDLKEFWHVGRDQPTSGYAHNIWPNEVEDMRDVFTDLYRQLDRCSLALLEACSIYLGEGAERLSEIAENGNSILRVIHYPPVPEDRHPESIRAAAHEDINLITLLCESTAAGLELLERSGRWRPVHVQEGQIIVDAGDMLQNISNGIFRSTTHRVVNPDNSHERRFSMPFFVHPRSEVALDPLASCINRVRGEIRYPKITAGQFLQQRLEEIGLA